MPMLLSSNDIAAEVRQLETELANAQRSVEASRLTDADKHANALRKRLEAKRSELAQVEKAESEAAAQRTHQQRLIALDKLASDESRAKSEILRLQREIAVLPGRLQLAQQRHAQLLKTKAALKQELGL